MNFTEGFAVKELLWRERGPILLPRDPPDGFIADDLRSLLGLPVHHDLIGSMNLVVRQNAVLQHEPPRPPPLPVIHPLVQYPRDPVPHYVSDPHLHRLLPRRMSRRRLAQPPVLDVVLDVHVVVGGPGYLIGSGWRGRRQRRHVVERRGVVGHGGHAAEGMHTELK